VQAGAGMWDSHFRMGGSDGTNLDSSNCSVNATGSYDPCYAAFLSLHLTPSSTGYFEGTWVWLADHDLDIPGQKQISVYAGRGILSESSGPVWMIGTASEHHVLYQYRLVNAANHYMGLIQTESPYFQPKPAPPTPFEIEPTFNDPTFLRRNPSAWGLSIENSNNIFIFGAGLYSFFVNYGQQCISTSNCQAQIANIDAQSDVKIYSLSTVATTYQISVDKVGIINQAGDINGFASTVTSWSSW